MNNFFAGVIAFIAVACLVGSIGIASYMVVTGRPKCAEKCDCGCKDCPIICDPMNPHCDYLRMAK